MASTLDDAFRALARPQRRQLLISLTEATPQADGGLDLPEEIPIDTREREKQCTELYHSHLPLLEEMGFIRWDRDAHEVEKGSHFDEIRPILQLIKDDLDELASHA